MAMLNNHMVYVFFNYELFVSNMMWCYRSILHWDDQWMTSADFVGSTDRLPGTAI